MRALRVAVVRLFAWLRQPRCPVCRLPLSRCPQHRLRFESSLSDLSDEQRTTIVADLRAEGLIRSVEEIWADNEPPAHERGYP